MGVADSEARAILQEFIRDGRLSPSSSERARWGDWERVTPAWVLLLGLKALVVLREEEGHSGSKFLAGQPPSGLSRDETDGLVEVLRGNLSAARVARADGVLTLTTCSPFWSP